MAIDDTIRDGKVQYDINGEAVKISALSPEKLINMNILQGRNTTLIKKE